MGRPVSCASRCVTPCGAGATVVSCCATQLVDFAGSSVPPALVRQLWDHALLSAWEQGDAGSSGGGGEDNGGGGGAGRWGRQAGLTGACQLVERLVPDFQPAR